MSELSKSTQYPSEILDAAYAEDEAHDLMKSIRTRLGELETKSQDLNHLNQEKLKLEAEDLNKRASSMGEEDFLRKAHDLMLRMKPGFEESFEDALKMADNLYPGQLILQGLSGGRYDEAVIYTIADNVAEGERSITPELRVTTGTYAGTIKSYTSIDLVWKVLLEDKNDITIDHRSDFTIGKENIVTKAKEYLNSKGVSNFDLKLAQQMYDLFERFNASEELEIVSQSLVTAARAELDMALRDSRGMYKVGHALEVLRQFNGDAFINYVNQVSKRMASSYYEDQLERFIAPLVNVDRGLSADANIWSVENYEEPTILERLEKKVELAKAGLALNKKENG